MLRPDSFPVRLNGSGCFCECGGCDIANGHTASTSTATEVYRACATTLIPDHAMTEIDDTGAPPEERLETPEQGDTEVDGLT